MDMEDAEVDCNIFYRTVFGSFVTLIHNIISHCLNKYITETVSTAFALVLDVWSCVGVGVGVFGNDDHSFLYISLSLHFEK